MLYFWVVRSIAIFAVLTVIYIALSLFKRWEERRRLGAEYDSLYAGGGATEPRDLCIQRGIHSYNGSLRRKLLLGVYLVPLAVLALLILLGQFG